MEQRSYACNYGGHQLYKAQNDNAPGLQQNTGIAVQKDLKILLRDAAEGLPVAKRKATWETERPTVMAIGDAVKIRGFVEYGRYCTV